MNYYLKIHKNLVRLFRWCVEREYKTQSINTWQISKKLLINFYKKEFAERGRRRKIFFNKDIF